MLLAKMFAGRDVYYEEVTLRFMYGRPCHMGCGGQAAALAYVCDLSGRTTETPGWGNTIPKWDWVSFTALPKAEQTYTFQQNLN